MRRSAFLSLSIIIFAVLTSLFEPQFLDANNLLNILRWSGLFGLLAIGASTVILIGHIDLAVGSVVGLAGTLLPFFLVEKELSLPLSILCVFFIASAIGFVHGVLVSKVKLQSFLVTLCGLFIYRGLARYITGERTQGFGADHESLRLLSKASFIGVPITFIYLVFLASLAGVILSHSRFGNYLFAIGGNERAAYVNGVDTGRVIITSFVISAILSALAGVLFALDQNSVQPSTFGNYYELYAIAGAVIGGCSLKGGTGTITGVVLGALSLELIRNAAFFLNFGSESEFTVLGVVILIGIIFDELCSQQES